MQPLNDHKNRLTFDNEQDNHMNSKYYKANENMPDLDPLINSQQMRVPFSTKKWVHRGKCPHNTIKRLDRVCRCSNWTSSATATLWGSNLDLGLHRPLIANAHHTQWIRNMPWSAGVITGGPLDPAGIRRQIN